MTRSTSLLDVAHSDAYLQVSFSNSKPVDARRPVFPTVGISRPRDDDDAGDGGPLAEVDHPDGRLDVEVVEHGAAVNARVHHAGGAVSASLLVRRRTPVVDDVVTDAGSGQLSVTSRVTLVLATTVDERVLLVRQVLHCTSHTARARRQDSDTLESFLSKVAFESDFRKKSCTHSTKTFAIFLLSK